MILGNRKTISKLFSDSVIYGVPHYQRRYVWDETNWRKLSEDILAQLGLEFKGDMDSGFNFEPVQDRENDLTSSHESGHKKHFTGIIVVRKIRDGDPEIFEVIDGQQRLTTFQIIFCVIRNIFESYGFDMQSVDTEGLIKGTRSTAEYQKFIPTTRDEDSFRRIINKQYGNPAHHTNKNVIRNILDTYDYFYSWILCYVQKSTPGNRTIDNNELDNLFSIIKN